MPLEKRLDIKVVGSLLILYVAWGSTYLAIHYVVESCPPVIASGFRNFLAGLLIFCWVFFTEKSEKIPFNHYLKMAIAGFLMLCLGNGLLTIAASWVPSGYMSLFPALVPAWIVIIQLILGTKPNNLTISGLILGFIGLFFLVNQEQLSIKGFEQYFTAGVSLLMAASISWGCGVMYSVKNPLPYSTAKVSSIQMIFGGLASLILSLFLNEWADFQPSNISSKAIWAFSYLLIGGSIIGFLVFSWVSKRASPTLVSTYSYVNPLVALYLGWLFLDEKLSFNILISAAFIVLAVVLITFGTAKVKN
ncbi:MAG: EamA family transporter [Bacteroidota bacterium]